MTMTEKILARTAGVESVVPGEIVVCSVDKVGMNDTGFLPSMAFREPLKVADRDRIMIIFDHAIPAPSVQDAEAQGRGREFARRFGIRHLYQHSGIGHQVILEEGLALPGELLTHSDSHTCSAGVVNCAGRGIGGLDILQVVCTGQTWFKVCPTIRYDLEGALRPRVFGKDVFLAIAREFGDHVGHNVEYGGSGLVNLPIDDRATMAAMGAEISAEFSVFAFDEVTAAFLDGRAANAYSPVEPDPDAVYAARRTIRLSDIEPHVSLPDFIPGNAVPVREVGDVSIDQAFIGSCANGKLRDLEAAAQVLEGKRIHPDVRLIVTPASRAVYAEAVQRGYISALLEAGATVTNSTCGACCGYHLGVLGRGEVCITSSTRNFKGRMGSPEASIYVASSATVAASAVAGRIVSALE